ncbi:hypothetical protein Cgig2_028174 [Carnegiea gigantea]|uniref:Uncharacterized protein n=1 Tax=Carnegiea gigantea TaxID=171969 RepID=A0A9Q1JNQ9_9CARY|nr:hypothetical protein Cgig2_028174 [Carnegiea gigantea]
MAPCRGVDDKGFGNTMEEANQGFGNTMEEEGRRTTPSSAACAVHAPPVNSGSDGSGQVLSIVYISTFEHGLYLLSWGDINFSVDWANQGFGNTMEEEGRQTTPSSTARTVHAPPLHSESDGSGQVLSIVYISTLEDGFLKWGKMLVVNDKGGLIRGFWF